MTTKYQRPAGLYDGAGGLGNRTKYRDDATAVPKRAISSGKVDSDFNYVIDALNQIDEASGSRASIADRLGVVMNGDGTLKASVTATLDDWVAQAGPGAMTRVDNSTFTMAGGDYALLYRAGRRVKLTVGGVPLYGDVASAVYAGGLTTVSLVDIVDDAGALAVIASAPTAVAYGPLTGGVQGNMPRMFAGGVTVPVGGVVYTVGSDGTDLVVRRAGSTVAKFTSGGVTGIASGQVAVGNLASDVAAKLVPSGAVMPYAGATAPAGWLLCDGGAVSRTTYAALFTAVSTIYGAGDGSTTFNLPDLRGRVVVALDNMGGTDSGRLSVANTLGGSGGSQTKNGTVDGHVLTVNEMPSHNHSINSGGLGIAPGGSVTQKQNAAADGLALAIGNTGGDQAHNHTITGFDVMPPYLLMNYIIKA